MVDDIKASTFALIALTIPTTTMNSCIMEVDMNNMMGNTNININLVNNTRGCCKVVDVIKGAIIASVTPTTSYSSYPLFAHSPLPLKIASLTMTYGSESFVKSHRPAKTFNYPETNG